ncbi:MAG: dienelactone hydrolase family protein [Candidatus Binataceae bacterium]
MFHRTAPPGFEGSYTDFAAVMPHYQAVRTETAEMDIRSGHEWLRSNAQVKANEISSVGFCMGGRVSFLANSVVPLRAAVSFYGESLPDCWTGRRRCRPRHCSSGVDWTSILRLRTGKR